MVQLSCSLTRPLSFSPTPANSFFSCLFELILGWKSSLNLHAGAKKEDSTVQGQIQMAENTMGHLGLKCTMCFQKLKKGFKPFKFPDMSLFLTGNTALIRLIFLDLLVTLFIPKDSK